MKIVCIKDTYTALKYANRSTTEEKSIEGLTLNKEYEASAVTITEGTMVDGIGQLTHKIRFLIFNDNGEWNTYQPELFEPRAE